jgi:predicted RNase H-like HicB family nuclease
MADVQAFIFMMLRRAVGLSWVRLGLLDLPLRVVIDNASAGGSLSGCNGWEESGDVRYAVIFEQAEPGCITTGSTLEETEHNIREAIEGHLQTLSEFGDRIPRPTTVAREIEIQSAA